MSITLVTGPPGSGKTLWTTRRIRQAVLDGRYVATNVVLVDDWAERIAKSVLIYRWGARRRRFVERAHARTVYVQTLDEVASLRLATDGWEKALEGRGQLIWDEAGEAFDSRAWNEDKDRRKRDNRFMRQHRKLGWDVFLVAQEEEQIDTRVRGMATYVVRLVNLKGLRLTWFLPAPPINMFRARWDWHGARSHREPFKLEVYRLNKKTARLYDTHQIVQTTGEEGADVTWLPRGHVPPEAVIAELVGQELDVDAETAAAIAEEEFVIYPDWYDEHAATEAQEPR